MMHNDGLSYIQYTDVLKLFQSDTDIETSV